MGGYRLQTSIGDFLSLIQQYGITLVLVVTLAAVVAILSRVIYNRLQDEIKNKQAENDKLQAEIRALYLDMQKYLVIGIATKQAINEATDRLGQR